MELLVTTSKWKRGNERYLHDGDRPEGDAGPVDTANYHAARHHGAQATDEQVGGVQHPHERARRRKRYPTIKNC